MGSFSKSKAPNINIQYDLGGKVETEQSSLLKLRKALLLGDYMVKMNTLATYAINAILADTTFWYDKKRILQEKRNHEITS